jgi:hypothetical protein
LLELKQLTNRMVAHARAGEVLTHRLLEGTRAGSSAGQHATERSFQRAVSDAEQFSADGGTPTAGSCMSGLEHRCCAAPSHGTRIRGAWRWPRRRLRRARLHAPRHKPHRRRRCPRHRRCDLGLPARAGRAAGKSAIFAAIRSEVVTMSRVELDEHREPGGALDEGCHLGDATAEHEVTFPVTGNGPGLRPPPTGRGSTRRRRSGCDAVP